MVNISEVWYREVLEEYVSTKYGSVDVLSIYDGIRDGKIRNYMYKQVEEKYHPEIKDIPKYMNENGRLCNKCINRYRR